MRLAEDLSEIEPASRAHEVRDAASEPRQRVASARRESAILVVESDRSLSEAVLVQLMGTRLCLTASTARAARERLLGYPGSFAGFLFAANLPDGSGIDLLRMARELAPIAPALVVATSADATLASRAYELGGSLVLTPIGVEAMRRFAAEALATDLVVHDTIRRRVAAFATRHCLTPAACEVLAAAVAGYTRDDILALRGVALNTYKTHVRQILNRSGFRSMDEVRRAILAPPQPMGAIKKVAG